MTGDAASLGAPKARPGWTVGAIMLGLGATLYVALTAGVAGYLLWQAYNPPPGTTLDSFEKLAIAALIGVMGTSITGLAAIYGATQQASTALQIARYNADISERLANLRATTDQTLLDFRTNTDRTLVDMRGKLDQSLANLKAASDESLARLRVALDVEHTACAELYGVATVYFYALRSVAQGTSAAEVLPPAEAAMIASTRQLLYASEEVRNSWFLFWQRATTIQREIAAATEVAEQKSRAGKLIEERIVVSTEPTVAHDLRKIHAGLERVCRGQIQSAWTRTSASSSATPSL